MLGGFRNSLGKIKAKQQLIDSYWDESTNTGLLDFYTRVTTSMGAAERCSIFINNPESETLWVQVGTGLENHQIEVPKEGSMVGSVISSGKPLFENNLENKDGAHKSVDSDTGFVSHNALCAPILSLDGTKVTGVIQMLNKKDNASFDDQDLSLLEEVARYMAFSIENIYLGQETLGVTENMFDTAKKLWFGFLGMTAIAMLTLFAFLIGLMAFV